MGRLPRTLSVPEAGDCLGVGRTTAHRLARIYRETGGAYALPPIRVGRKLRVPGVLLAEHIAEDWLRPTSLMRRATRAYSIRLLYRRPGPRPKNADRHGAAHSSTIRLCLHAQHPT